MDNVWRNVQDLISTKISKASYETQLKNTTAEIIENTAIIKVPNSFAKDWIESQYKSLITDCLSEVTGKNYELTVVVDKEMPNEIRYDSSGVLGDSNTYDKLINLIKEQDNLLQKQQERIEALEKRVDDLEMKGQQ